MSFNGELTPLNLTSKGSFTGKSLAGTKPFSSFRIGIGDPQYRCLDTPQSLSLKFVDLLPQFNSFAFFSIALKASSKDRPLNSSEFINLFFSRIASLFISSFSFPSITCFIGRLYLLANSKSLWS